MLVLAVRCNQAKIVKSLIRTSIQCQPAGESIVYLASQSGSKEILNTILDAFQPMIYDINFAEPLRGWTPLIVACIEGHESVVKLLIDAEADQWKRDHTGWTAKEHATYRGYLQIAALFTSSEFSSLEQQLPGFNGWKNFPFLKNTALLSEDKSGLLTDSHIIVTLGSPNTRYNTDAVNLYREAGSCAKCVMSAIGFILEVTTTDAVASEGADQTVRIPAYEDTINQPWHFTAEIPNQVKLHFRLFRHSDNRNERQVVGSGIALLQNLQHGFASRREGLARYHTIPILGRETSEYMGTVTFGLVVVRPPPSRRAVPASAKSGFWKEGSTQVVGHRGSGANSATQGIIQLGENTMQSFESAAALGAKAVEFDVQLTKDLIPVIYHDFLVMEAGGDNPIYSLRLDQFLHLSKAQSAKADLSGMAEKRYVERNKLQSDRPDRQRSYSLSVYDNGPVSDLKERMKLTEAAMEGAHKGNLQGDSVHGIYPKFEDLFTILRDSVGFNVEMKYPMLWEAEDRNMDRYAPEINTYVDIILEIIYRLGGGRSITFSSFSPEVCILLSLKQQDYPVLFLSKGGSVPTGDVRCSSLQQSIRFAKRWNLAGE